MYLQAKNTNNNAFETPVASVDFLDRFTGIQLKSVFERHAVFFFKFPLFSKLKVKKIWKKRRIKHDTGDILLQMSSFTCFYVQGSIIFCRMSQSSGNPVAFLKIKNRGGELFFHLGK